MKKQKSFKIIIISMITMSFFLLPVNAFAAQTTIIKDQLLTIGVKESKVDALVEKVKDGEKLDSMKSEYNNIEATQKGWINENTYEEKYVYPDGSVKSLSISAGTFTGKVSGGDYHSGTYWYTWNNARVMATWGVVTASFRANFEGSKGSGIIHKVYDYGIITAGGTFSSQSLKINRAKATSSSPAQATLFFIGTVVNDFGQATFYLRLYVPYKGECSAKLSVLN